MLGKLLELDRMDENKIIFCFFEEKNYFLNYFILFYF